MAKKRINKYIDNAELLDEVIKCKENDNIPSDKLVELLNRIVQHVGRSRNFINYTYNEDLKQEAIIHAIYKGIPGFNPEKFSNAFAFFSTLIVYKFIEVIKRENRFVKLKDVLIEVEEERVSQETTKRL